MIISAIRLSNIGVFSGINAVIPAYAKSECSANITLIGGMNGAGKTSLLEAVLLALYGRRSPSVHAYEGRYYSYLRDLTSRRPSGESRCWVELELMTEKGATASEIRIRRSWPVSAARLVETVEVWVDGDRDTFLAGIWDSYVEEIMPLGLAELFFFDGEKISELAEADETPLGVQKAIRYILGIDLVVRLENDLSRVAHSVHRRGRRVTDASKRYDEIRKHIHGLEAEYEACHREWASVNTHIGRLKGERERARDAFVALGGTLSQKREEFEAAKADVTTKLESAKGEQLAAASGVLPLLMVKGLLAEVARTAAREKASREARAILPELEARNKCLESVMIQNGIGQPAFGLIMQEVRRQEDELRSRCSNGELLPMAHLGIEQLALFLSSYDWYAANLASSIRRTEEIEKKLRQVSGHLGVALDEDGLKTALDQVDLLSHELGALDADRQGLAEKMESLHRSIEKAKSDEKKAFGRMVDLESDSRIFEWVTRTQETISEFGEKLAQSRVHQLCKSIQEAFRALTHKSNLFSSITIDVSTLSIRLWHDEEGEIPKSRLSKGERQMLAIAVLWGLARSSGFSLPIIIDTPLGRLDSSHRANFVSQYLPHSGRQVIVLSTDTEITGVYLESLQDHIGHSYTLDNSSSTGVTTIANGYFVGGGGAIDDSQAG